jgi:hypothetical protein
MRLFSSERRLRVKKNIHGPVYHLTCCTKYTVHLRTEGSDTCMARIDLLRRSPLPVSPPFHAFATLTVEGAEQHELNIDGWGKPNFYYELRVPKKTFVFSVHKPFQCRDAYTLRLTQENHLDQFSFLVIDGLKIA